MEDSRLAFDLECALENALFFHDGHKRKGTGTPYISHLLRVSGMVIGFGGSRAAAAAALLHDAVEDTEATHEIIDKNLGSVVGDIVKELTEDKILSWEERKQHKIDNLPNMSDDAFLVLCCDVIDNSRALVEDGDLIDWSKFKMGRKKTIEQSERMLIELIQELGIRRDPEDINMKRLERSLHLSLSGLRLFTLS